MREREASSAVTIRLEGTFDLPSARLLEHSLRRAGAGERVRIDFGRVRQLNDFAVAFLARALERSSAAEVRVVGLGLHHVRLLRYFGVSTDVFRREGEGAPG